ncbi:MAG: DNA ligase D [Acidobacteria bacterium]|nr:DNA ligase D [Acidobacteriota bacterium]
MFDARHLRPMLAVGGEVEPPLEGDGLLYEPKYDGIRAIVEVAAAGGTTRARLWSRNGNEKTAQFPDLVEALEEWGAAVGGTVVLDGEVVALDANGRPQGFQRLQHRIHVAVPGYRSKKAQLSPAEQAAALIVFDLLRVDTLDLREHALSDRRAALETLLLAHPFPSNTLRLSEQHAGSGVSLHEQAEREGWEGLLVKVARSPYRTGKRSPEWRKLKLQKFDEFVICGYTDPQGTRARFGALVLGAHAAPGSHDLLYMGDVGTGFTRDEIERLWTALQRRVRASSPLHNPPAGLLRRAHWVAPTLVAQVRYTEVTDEGRLRHPAYLGLRDDKKPADVVVPGRESSNGAPAAGAINGDRTVSKSTAAHTRKRGPSRKQTRTSQPEDDTTLDTSKIVEQLTALEQAKKDGRITLPDGDTLEVTNLQKVFWPEIERTKGDLLRYYAGVAPLLLPVIDDRPLVMKRLPNGVTGKAFYQHRAPEPVPPGVRTETLPDDDVPARLVGGGLKTLLYMAQLASISMDPFFSTMRALDYPDHVAIDLDPQPGATFAQILDVARWVHEILERVGVNGYPKTSGSEGLHIFIPLPEGTPYDAGLLFCQIVATMVAAQHPKVATVERMVKRRQAKTIYVDYLQNIQGKTLACAYSARASAFAGVSAPLTWAEVHDSPAPQDFTIDTMPARIEAVGDLWAALRNDRGADLLEAIKRLGAG